MKVGTDAMLLGAILQSEGHKNALEIGTGTGVISLMLAQKNKELAIDALEIDLNSFLDASLNFQNSKFLNVLNAIHVDFLEYELHKKYDLIFSNPPYYSNGLLPENQNKQQAKHIGQLTIPTLFEKMKINLTSEGKVWLIFPFNDFHLWDNVAAEFQFHKVEVTEIFSKKSIPSRLIVCYSLIPYEINRKKIVIRNETNCYTEEYVELTKDFHNRSPIR